jgi:hypothetical protein
MSARFNLPLRHLLPPKNEPAGNDPAGLKSSLGRSPIKRHHEDLRFLATTPDRQIAYCFSAGNPLNPTDEYIAV